MCLKICLSLEEITLAMMFIFSLKVNNIVKKLKLEFMVS